MFQRSFVLAALCIAGLAGCGTQHEIEPDQQVQAAPPLEHTEVVVEERLPQILADAGSDRAVYEGEMIDLDTAETQYDGEQDLVFAWRQTKGPAVPLAEPDSPAFSLMAPEVDADTEFEFLVTVGDGKVADRAFVSIEVLDRPAPVAIALSRQGNTFAVGEPIVLDAAGSESPIGSMLTYEWIQTAGPTVELEDATQAIIEFDAPAISSNAAEIMFDVVVTDGHAMSKGMVRVIIYAPGGGGFAPTGGGGFAAAGGGGAPSGGGGTSGGGAPSGGGTTATGVTAGNPGSVTGFSLIDANSNEPVPEFDPVESGVVFDLDVMPAMSFEAHAGSTTPASIKLQLRQDGQIIVNRTENELPYALFGDNEDGFVEWDVVGPHDGSNYVLTAIPYSQRDGKGAAGTAVSVTFATISSSGGHNPQSPQDDTPGEVIVDEPADPVQDDPITPEPECAGAADCDDGNYCNGAESCSSGTCVAGDPPCTGMICDEAANTCEQAGADVECATDGDCANELFCAGARQCIDGVCINGPSPCGSSEICDETTDQCVEPAGMVYYVGHDVADPDSPYCTIDNPCSTPQEAVELAGPGDTIIIRGGTYSTGTTVRSVKVIDVEEGGQPGFPLTIQAAPGEHVILSGDNGNTDILVRIVAPHVIFEGFELTGARRIGVFIAVPAHDVIVRMCHAHHNSIDMSWIGAAFRTGGPVHDILFEDCISHDNSGGFQLREEGNLTAGTASTPPKAGNIGFNNDLAESQWDSWPGWTQFAARNVTLRRCMAFNNTLLEEHSDGIQLRYSDRCTVEDCISFHNADDGVDLLGASRCTVRGSIAFDNDPYDSPNGDGNGFKIGVRGGLDHIVHNNISFENNRGGIDMADTERGTVYNNTCHDNRLWFGLWFEGGRSETGHFVANNLLASNPKADVGRSAHVIIALFLNNLLSDSNAHNWAPALDAASFMETDPVLANPNLSINTSFPAGYSIPQKIQFIRDQVHEKLGLATDSPAIDAGTAVPGLSGDFAGDAPDIGAIEHD